MVVMVALVSIVFPKVVSYFFMVAAPKNAPMIPPMTAVYIVVVSAKYPKAAPMMMNNNGTMKQIKELMTK